ncbi:MAG TPA: UDP-N-acetylglucosamine 1-carboxyvinyltransferase [Clostridiales bacterium]|nr:UDP-N-acetylglucosamine 1-carboxyvinyltransferase [Clostridiales bacterium]
MDQFVITGGNRLVGEVEISGAKNAALGILSAALLVHGPCRIENVPNIADVRIFLNVAQKIGAVVEKVDEKAFYINSSGINSGQAVFSELRNIRSSYYLLGALICKTKCVEIPLPGGCNIGARPIDQHIKGFEALGAKVHLGAEKMTLSADKLIGTQIYMDVVTVGATINLMMAAVLADGVTVLENAAREPHIVDVANFLNMMGANIKGAGTNRIRITGVKELTGGKTYSIIPDQIEAGTFMIAAAATGGDVYIRNIIPEHMDPLCAKLIEMNVNITQEDDWIRVVRNKELMPTDVITLPYPGFPTDLQPQMGALMCLSNGECKITETIFENRLQYTDQLKKMKAKIKVDGNVAVIKGVGKLSGATVKALDLRAGAAMIIAGLFATGQTRVQNIEYIDRGYEEIEVKLNKLGANISREL